MPWPGFNGFRESKRRATKPRLWRGTEGLQRETMAWASLLSSGTATTAMAKLSTLISARPAHAEAYAKPLASGTCWLPIPAQALDPGASGSAPVPLGIASARSRLPSAAQPRHRPHRLQSFILFFGCGLRWRLGADVRTGTGEQRGSKSQWRLGRPQYTQQFRTAPRPQRKSIISNSSAAKRFVSGPEGR